MTTRPRTLLIAAACTFTGAGGALGVDALSSSARSGHHHHGEYRFAKRAFARHAFGGGFFRAVHADAVVPTKDGTFATVTLDRGVVKSVSGQDVTLTEGTRTATYKDETITVPGDARVRVLGTPNATLADVPPGMRAAIVQAPKKTFVLAAPARDPTSR